MDNCACNFFQIRGMGGRNDTLSFCPACCGKHRLGDPFKPPQVDAMRILRGYPFRKNP